MKTYEVSMVNEGKVQVFMIKSEAMTGALEIAEKEKGNDDKIVSVRELMNVTIIT